MKFLIFSIFVGNFCPPGSESGYGSTDLIGSGSSPDLKHWVNEITCYLIRGRTVVPSKVLFALNVRFIRRAFDPCSIWFLIVNVARILECVLAPCRICLKLFLHYCDVRLVQQ
jgi:hypothetical protein